MAIYHLSATPISRDKGQSSVASAAYRAAEKLYDERLDKVFDYSHKLGVVHTEILLPEGAPTWMQDRQKLWNQVEATEKRKDAQLARDFNMSLPRELTREQNTTLAREYIQQNFVALGMVADFAIHEDKSKDGELQPHVHVMLTMRSVGPDGFGKKVRDWNSKAFMSLWRETWAETTNKHLALNGHDMRIDHRSLQEQGIDLEPQHKRGAASIKVELARTQDHQRIAHENGEKLMQHPEIALHAITQQQSTFTHHDLARFVNRHTVDADQFQHVYDKVKTSAELVSLGQDEQGKERYTTRDMQHIEMDMFGFVAERNSQALHLVSNLAILNAKKSRTLSLEQSEALTHITQGSDIAAIIGFAGTGKSYMLGAAREAWEQSGYRVIGATLSGIAAEGLEASSGISSRTLASLSWAWDKGRDKLTSKDIIVIDEAGMLGTRDMAKVFTEANRAGAKVVLVGDPEQLQAIAAGAAFRGIAERIGYVELSNIQRQRVDWQRIATKEFATHQTPKAIARYSEQGFVHALPTQDDAKQAMVNDWNRDRLASPDTSSIMLAYTREDVKTLNEMARNERVARNELGADNIIKTALGERRFAIGDRLYFLKNENSLGVKNGRLGTIEAIRNGQLTVRLDNKPEHLPRRVKVNTTLYNHIDHGYAATIYKAQSVTVNRGYMLASPYLDSHGTYVGSSRHQDSLNIYYSKSMFATEQKLILSLSRERGKDLIVDYTAPKELDNPISHKVKDVDIKAIAAQQFKDDLAKAKGQSHARTSDFNVTMATKEKVAMHRDANLQRYQAEFEAKHPSMARAIQQSTIPTHEHKATDAMRTWQQLETSLTQPGMSRRAKETMQNYAAELKQKQPDVMQYFKLHHPDMGKRIESFAKSYQLEKDIGEISL